MLNTAATFAPIASAAAASTTRTRGAFNDSGDGDVPGAQADGGQSTAAEEDDPPDDLDAAWLWARGYSAGEAAAALGDAAAAGAGARLRRVAHQALFRGVLSAAAPEGGDWDVWPALASGNADWPGRSSGDAGTGTDVAEAPAGGEEVEGKLP